MRGTGFEDVDNSPIVFDFPKSSGLKAISPVGSGKRASAAGRPGSVSWPPVGPQRDLEQVIQSL